MHYWKNKKWLQFKRCDFRHSGTLSTCHVKVASNSAALFLIYTTPTIYKASFILLAMTKGNARKVSFEICSDGQVCYKLCRSSNFVPYSAIDRELPVFEASYFVHWKVGYLIRVDCKLFLVFSKIVENEQSKWRTFSAEAAGHKYRGRQRH